MQIVTAAPRGTVISFPCLASSAVYTGTDAANMIIGGIHRETL
jgi:hypothetical protein